MKNVVILLAAGQSERMGKEMPKQFLKFGDSNLIEYCLSKFQNHNHIDEIVLVLPSSTNTSRYHYLKKKYFKLSKIIHGGKSRFESSYLAIKCIDNQECIILVHDVARPFVTNLLITNLIKSVKSTGACIPVTNSSDTIFLKSNNLTINSLLDRDKVVMAQTPQCFQFNIILSSFEKAIKNRKQYTDEASMVLELSPNPIKIIFGENSNFKITTSTDFQFAQFLLEQNKE